RPKGSRRIVASGRLDADHAAIRRQCLGGKSRPREQATASAWHQNQVERAHFLEQLARRSPRARDDLRGLVGRYHSKPACGGELYADRFTVLTTLAVVEDDLSTVVARRRALYGRRVGGHHDHARNVEQLPGKCDGLGVIAGREGNDAAAALVGRELRERVVCTS